MLSQIISSKLLNLTKSSTVFFIMLTFVVGNTAQASYRNRQSVTVVLPGTVATVLAAYAETDHFQGHKVIEQGQIDGRDYARVALPDRKGVIFLGPDNESMGVPVTWEHLDRITHHSPARAYPCLGGGIHEHAGRREVNTVNASRYH